jgi:hypothetical protein
VVKRTDALTVNVADTRALQQKWEQRVTKILLQVLESPYREIARPVVAYAKNLRRRQLRSTAATISGASALLPGDTRRGITPSGAPESELTLPPAVERDRGLELTEPCDPSRKSLNGPAEGGADRVREICEQPDVLREAERGREEQHDLVRLGEAWVGQDRFDDLVGVPWKTGLMRMPAGRSAVTIGSSAPCGRDACMPSVRRCRS